MAVTKVSIPGFPSKVGGPYDLPDIGELLLFPAFQGIAPEDFRHYATDFQKYIFDQIPLRNDKKNVLIRSGVWLLQPRTRSHVSGRGDWHIDGMGDYDHILPRERVYILSSPCHALTEFNVNPLEIESRDGENRYQFVSRIKRNPFAYGIVGLPIKPCQLYLFENHFHRAVEPDRIEFRFFLRVRETDALPFSKEPLKNLEICDVGSRQGIANIDYTSDGVLIRYPRR